MSTTGDVVRNEVYVLLGVTNMVDPQVIDSDGIRKAITNNVAVIAKEIGLGPAWLTPGISLVTNAMDYTLPAGVEYDQVLSLVYTTDKWPLQKVSRDEILNLRAGVQNSTGRRFEYAMYPDASGLVQVMFGRFPQKAEGIDVLASTVPVPWNAGDAVVPNIPFSTTAVRALEYLAAAEYGAAFGPDRIVALNINPNVFKTWQDKAMELIRQERLTVIRLKRSNGPMNYTWYSAWWGN